MSPTSGQFFWARGYSRLESAGTSSIKGERHRWPGSLLSLGPQGRQRLVGMSIAPAPPLDCDFIPLNTGWLLTVRGLSV